MRAAASPDGCATGRTTEPPAGNTIGTLPPHQPGASPGNPGNPEYPGAETPGLQPQNEQRENLRKVSLLLWSGKRNSHSRCARAVPRISADTPDPWKGRFEVAYAESLMHRHTKERGKNLLDSSLLFWSGKRISDPSIFLVHNQRITQSIFLKGHSRDAVIMHSFASQCFRQR